MRVHLQTREGATSTGWPDKGQRDLSSALKDVWASRNNPTNRLIALGSAARREGGDGPLLFCVCWSCGGGAGRAGKLLVEEEADGRESCTRSCNLELASDSPTGLI